MTQTGSVIGHELFLRCPHCGDSQKDPTKAHFRIHLTKGVFFCFRCGESGKVPLKYLLEFTEFYGHGIKQKTQKTSDIFYLDKNLLPGPGSSRSSSLDRFHYDDGEIQFDVFESKDVHGEVIGYHTRRNDGKWFVNWGERGFGYKGSYISQNNPVITLVEGPYDVLEPDQVCCFGDILGNHLRTLKDYDVILCPDGDLWKSPWWRKRLKKRLTQTLSPRQAWSMAQIKGVYFLPDEKDPDEVPRSDWRLFERSEFTQLISELR